MLGVSQVAFPLQKKKIKTEQKKKNTEKQKTVHLDCIVDRHDFIPSLLQELIPFLSFFVFFLCVCFSSGSEFSPGLLHQGTFYVEAYPRHWCNLFASQKPCALQLVAQVCWDIKIWIWVQLAWKNPVNPSLCWVCAPVTAIVNAQRVLCYSIRPYLLWVLSVC